MRKINGLAIEEVDEVGEGVRSGRGSRAFSKIPGSARVTRGRPRIQDEWTDRDDLTSSQKFDLRHPERQYQRAHIPGARTMAERMWRVDLGLALLSLVAIPGVPLTTEDISVWCGCTRANIHLIEKKALKKLRNALFFGDRETWDALRDYLTARGMTAS